MTNLRLKKTEKDGTKVYHYTAPGKPGPGYPQGIPTGFVRRVKNGKTIEDRQQTFEDVAN